MRRIRLWCGSHHVLQADAACGSYVPDLRGSGASHVARWTTLCLVIMSLASVCESSTPTHQASPLEVLADRDATASLTAALGGPLNYKCVSERCGSQVKACVEDWTCDVALACSAKCMLGWRYDDSPGKIKSQNCTTKCAASYGDKTYDAAMGCLMKNHCVSFPSTGVTCQQPAPDPALALSDMSGEWWQHWGHNKLWDCYPCQHIHSMKPINPSTWAYTWSYDVFYENNTLDLIGSTWPLPLAPRGERISFNYWYLGTAHNETWTLLGGNPERYLLVYVCSIMDSWTNVGSIVWVRPGVELNSTEVQHITATYHDKLGMNTGWDFPQDFCYDRHGPAMCPPPQ